MGALEVGGDQVGQRAGIEKALVSAVGAIELHHERATRVGRLLDGDVGGKTHGLTEVAVDLLDFKLNFIFHFLKNLLNDSVNFFIFLKLPFFESLGFDKRTLRFAEYLCENNVGGVLLHLLSLFGHDFFLA